MNKLVMNLMSVSLVTALIAAVSACDTRAVADESKTRPAPRDAGVAPSSPDAGPQGSRKKDADKGSKKQGSGHKGSGSSSTTSPPRGYQ